MVATTTSLALGTAPEQHGEAKPGAGCIGRFFLSPYLEDQLAYYVDSMLNTVAQQLSMFGNFDLCWLHLVYVWLVNDFCMLSI